MMAQLMRLQIPKGWSICDNKFYDTVPIIEENSDFIKNWHEGFLEDVLWIQECKVNNKGDIEIPKSNCFIIDLSWLPESSIKGQYILRLYWITIDGMMEIESFENTDRYEIRNKLEFWMNDIFEKYPEYQEKMNNLH